MKNSTRFLPPLILLVLGIVAGILGFIVRVMHWPHGNALSRSGLIIVGIAVIWIVIIFAVRKRRQS